jgi:hypothetical protein
MIAAGRDWRKSFLAALGVWAVALLAHLVVAELSAIPPGGPLPDGILRSWYQWDSVWFTRIAEHGYPATGPYAPAFFPLYPLLMAALNPILPGDAFVAGLVVASLAALAALVLLHRLIDTEPPGTEPADPGTASRALWYLVAFPTGFFLTAAYNTGLFLALTVGSVYAMRRERWWLAGLLAALAGATRSSGLLLLVPMAYEYLRVHGRRIRPDVLSLALVPAGLLGFMAYTWRALGDPLAFLHAQRHWSRQVEWPWLALDRQVEMIIRHKLFGDTGLHNLIDLGAVLLSATLVTLCFVGPWKLRRDQWALPVYGAVLVLFMVLFPNGSTKTPYPLQSSVRFFLEIFPAFLVMARIGARPLADRAYLVIAVSAQAILLAIFLHGGWVA